MRSEPMLRAMPAGGREPALERVPVPDAAWVARAVRGEPGAFARLYEGHVDAVYRYVHFRVRDGELAQDLTHDVFVRALAELAALREPARFAPWLMRIAHNRVANHWRAHGGPRATESMADGEPDGDGMPAADGIAAADRRVEATRAWALAAGLTPLQRTVVGLRFVAGLSVAETAAVMGRSENAVKNLQHHALRGLRDRLAAGARREEHEDGR